jgi:uncharacterized protein YfaS (alpha-2-macroglobulin family)
MPGPYVVGQVITLTLVVTVGGTPTNPTALTAKVEKPDGTVLSEDDLVPDADGNFHYDFAADLPGSYWCRFEGTGAAAGAAETMIYVSESRVAAA